MLIDAGMARLAGMLGFNWHSLPPTLEGKSAFADRLFELTFNEDFSRLPAVRSCASRLVQCCAGAFPVMHTFQLATPGYPSATDGSAAFHMEACMLKFVMLSFELKSRKPHRC